MQRTPTAPAWKPRAVGSLRSYGAADRWRRSCANFLFTFRVEEGQAFGLQARRCRGKRQLDEECRTISPARFDPDAASHASDQFAADVETETGAADSPGRVRIQAVELLEDPLLLGLRNTDALVTNRYAKVSPTRLELDLDTAGAKRILDCVAHEVREHLPELVTVCGDCGNRGGRHELERELLWSVCARGLDDPACDVRDVDLLACENEPAGVDLAREQDVVDEIDKPLGLVRDDGEESGGANPR